MNIPSKILLSYVIDTNISDELSSIDNYQGGLLYQFNKILLLTDTSYLLYDQIRFIQDKLVQYQNVELNLQDQLFIENVKIYFNLESTNMQTFMNKFQIDQEVEKQQTEQESNNVITSPINIQTQGINSQHEFDNIFMKSSQSQKIELFKNAYAKSSVVAMQEKVLYFDLIDKKDIVHLYNLGFEVVDLIYLFDEILQNKNKKQMLDQLCNKSVLSQYKNLNNKIFDYIIQKDQIGDEIFELQQYLQTSEEVLYNACYNGLISESQLFGISDQFIDVFYSLFAQHMTKIQFDNLYKINFESFSPNIHVNTITCIGIIANKKFNFHLDSVPQLFFVGQYKFDGNVKFFSSNKNIQEVCIYYSNQEIDESIIIQKPNQIINDCQDGVFIINQNFNYVLCLFKTDNFIYKWGQKLRENKMLVQLQQDKLIVDSKNFSKVKFNDIIYNQQSKIELQLDQLKDQQQNILLMDNNNYIIQRNIQKPQYNKVLTCQIDFSQLTQGKININGIQNGYYICYENQKIFVKQQVTSIQVFGFYSDQKFCLFDSASGDLQVCISIQNQNSFYYSKFEVILSSIVLNEKIIFSQQHDVTAQPCNYKVYVYNKQINFHLFSSQKNIETKVSLLITKLDDDKIITEECNLISDKYGYLSINNSLSNITSIQLKFKFLEQHFMISHEFLQTKQQQLPLLNVSYDGKITTFLPQELQLQFRIDFTPVKYFNGSIQLDESIQFGKHKLYAYNGIIWNQIADVNILQQQGHDDELLNVYQLGTNKFAISKADFQINGLFIDQMVRKSINFQQPEIQNIPLQTDPPFIQAAQIHINSQQQYDQKLFNAFKDIDCTASFAKQFPTIFLKEQKQDQIQPMMKCCQSMFGCPPCMPNGRSGANFAANMQSRCSAKMTAGFHMAAPGCYMNRSDCFLEVAQEETTVLQQSDVMDLCLFREQMQYEIIDHDNYYVVEIQQSNHTAVQISLQSNQQYLNYTQTIDLQQSVAVEFIEPKQPILQQNKSFVSKGTILNIQNYLTNQSQIYAIYASWDAFNLAQKKVILKQYLCFDLMIFVKFNDVEFFKNFAKKMFQAQFYEKTVVGAFILDDYEFLLSKESSFFELNQFEQFLILYSKQYQNQDLLMFFITSCGYINNKFDEAEFINQCQNSKKIDFNIDLNQQSQKQMTYYNQTNYNLDFDYCNLFVQILKNTIVSPNIDQCPSHQKSILISFIWNHQWYIQQQEFSIKDIGLSVKFLLNGQKHYQSQKLNTLEVQFNNKLIDNVTVWFQLYDTDIVVQDTISKFDITQQQQIVELAKIFPQHDFSLNIKVFQNSQCIYDQVVSFKAEPLNVSLVDIYQNSTITSSKELISLFLSNSTISQKQLANILVQKQLGKNLIYQIYVDLKQIGVFNPWLLQYSQQNDLDVVRELYYSTNCQDFIQLYDYTQIEKLPFTRNSVLNKEISIEFQKCIVKSLFRHNPADLFLNLVKSGHFKDAKQVLPQTRLLSRYKNIVSYYEKCIDNKPYHIESNFNRFNIDFNSAKKDDISQQLSYIIKNNNYQSSNDTQISIGEWRYEPAQKISIKANNPFQIPSDKFITIYNNNQRPIVILPQPMDVEIKHIQHGIQVTKNSQPVKNLLVISYKDNKIITITYTDRFGRARCSNRTEIYETISKFIQI